MEKTLILSVETSGRTGSVALGKGKKILEKAKFSAPMKHSAELFPVVSGMLEHYHYTPDQINHIYISVGPGSFTGLRIAVTMAKLMALANSTKIVAVDTLDIIALNGQEFIEDKTDSNIERIGVILDAKRGRFFAAAYEKTQTGWKKIMEDCLITANEFVGKFENQKPIWLLGEGLVYYKGKFERDTINIMDEELWYPCAEKLYKLGSAKAEQKLFEDPQALAPAYLCRPEAEENKIKKDMAESHK